MGYFPPPRPPLTVRLRLWFGWQTCRLIGHRLGDYDDPISGYSCKRCRT